VDLGDPGFVREQYASSEKLATRMSVWEPDATGRWPQDVALDAIKERAPMRLLEVGAGTGGFAARCASELGCDVVALDSARAMVAASRDAGVESVLGDVRYLPFADGTFDVCVAAWMLYHVQEPDTALGELARVLRTPGRLVAITNGRDHIGELWDLVGVERFESSFSRENGPEQLARHFTHVTQIDMQTRAVFPDRASAVSYLESLERGDVAERLPDQPEPLNVHGAPTVFMADKS
jgi:ubiquinone/menaquinone biosynthesis C-methylase UbiE